MNELRPDSEETQELLNDAQRGDGAAVDRLLARHRDDLRSFVEARLDPRLGARIDLSDGLPERSGFPSSSAMGAVSLKGQTTRQPGPASAG